MLLGVADQVVDREPVVGGYEVDRRPGTAALLLEQVAGARDAGGQFGDLSGVAAPEPPYGISVTVVPFGPARREASQAIAAVPQIPGLGNQLDLRKDRVLANGVQKAGVGMELLIMFPGQGGCQIEAEAVDVHFLDPVA